MCHILLKFPSFLSMHSIITLVFEKIDKKPWKPTRCTASSPPTTIAPPTTTFNYIPDRSAIDIQPKQNFDSPTYRQPDNNSIQFNDKGIKYQSNLNEIDKFEHKSQSDTASKAYEWPASSKENAVGSK